MDNWDYSYLCSLIDEANEKQKQYPFSPPDEEGADISYIPSKLKLHWPGAIGSLHFRYEMEKYHICERRKLRKDAQNYFRIVRKAGKIVRIDTFVHGRLVVIFLMHYEGNKRYAFPFSRTGGFYPSYTQVQVYDDSGDIAEDYMVRSKQIVHYRYSKCAPNTVQEHLIIYFNRHQDPVNHKEVGHYTLGDSLIYTEEWHWTWNGLCLDKK